MNSNIDDWQGIAVFMEQDNGIIENISWELLGKARELADTHNETVTAIVLSNQISELADTIIARGADKVIVADHEFLDHYKYEVYSKIGYEIITQFKPSILLMGATANGVDLAGRLAIRLNTGLTADVVELELNDEGLLLGSVPGFGGSVLALIKCEDSRPQMATVRPGIFEVMEPDESRTGEVINFDVNINKDEITTRLIRKIDVDMEDISKADRLVAAGRGIGEHLDKAQELAEIINGDIGVTRPLCDMGLLPRNYQIGSTGVTVKADITLVLGASGAMHFTTGIDDSENIIAVNIDEEAPIFDYADYIVKGDINELLPEILNALKRKLGKTQAKEVA